jgi:hypothetical protein
MMRLVVALIAPLLATTSLQAADDLPTKAESVPGTCFVYKVDEETGVEKDPASAFVSRIDLQPLQLKVEGKPIPETRFRIGLQLKSDNSPMVDDHSTACIGEKLAFTCTMKCGDKTLGRFKAEALPTKPKEPKADYLRLVIETPTVINGCSEGKKPMTVPEDLVGLQIILKGADKSACFN